MLSLTIFLPLLASITILFLKKQEIIRLIALLGSGLTFLLSLFLLVQFQRGFPGFQFLEQFSWIESVKISYLVGLDGISLPLFLLTTLLTLLVIIYSWNKREAVPGGRQDFKRYFALLLFLETSMLGVFSALDLFLFYLFFELCLVPMYFLIGIWGGPNRQYAAIKFFLYTLLGSVFILLALLVLYFSADPHTFNFLELTKNPIFTEGSKLALLTFWAFFLGFAIKLPVVPLHTWLPDAHVEAPTGGSVILAGIFLKMGGYGMIRFMLPLLPEPGQKFALILAILALISIIYGSFVAMAQRDFKKLVAYSSISHMGYVLLGIAAAFALSSNLSAKITALNGSVYQMVAHGLITGGLFFLVGMLYQRTGTRNLEKMGGLKTILPVYGGILMFSVFASLGLPGLAGFIAEFLVLIGSFPIFKIITALALIGIILTATYFVRLLQKVLMGPLNEKLKFKILGDLNKRELLVMVPLLILIFILGIFPSSLLTIIETSTKLLVP